MKIILKKIAEAISLIILLASCEGFVEADLPNSRIIKEVVFDSDETAIAAMDGVYNVLYNSNGFASGDDNSIAALGALSSDELEVFSAQDLQEYFQNEITTLNNTNLNLWSSAYNCIYMVNAIIEGVTASNGIRHAVKTQLLGEAKFIRAFTYFYLLNIYGDIPCIISTDYTVNAVLPRHAVGVVYDQVIEDLTDAQNLLTGEYRKARTTPNSYAATLLLARVFLYLKDYDRAEILSGKVIDEAGGYEILEELDNVFLSDSQEALWQIAPVINGYTREGNMFILDARPTLFALNPHLVEAFPANDKRLLHWIGRYETEEEEIFYYPYKYKIKTSTDDPLEYSIVLRFAESYLIRAEARARQGQISGAIADIDVIRKRAGEALISEINPHIQQEDLLEVIFNERRLELFTEWGHRWLDLKRTNRVEEWLNPVKPLWQPYDIFYPIPDQERSKNPNLGQNTGY